MTLSASAGHLWARLGLDPVSGVCDGIEIQWEGGRFTHVTPAPRPPSNLPAAQCFDQHLLTPGLLNAHVHLEYSFLRNRLPRNQGFGPWLRAIITLRRTPGAMNEDQARESIAQALHEMTADGITEIWDIDSYAWNGIKRLRNGNTPGADGLAAIRFLEWMAPTSQRADQWEDWIAEHEPFFSKYRPESDTPMAVLTGLSPHAPYTVCQTGLERAACWGQQTDRPLAIHLAESLEERELMLEGRGALQDLHEELIGLDLAGSLGVGRSSIERAGAAGLLGPATLAIHCNLPEPGEAERLAQSRCVVVFCPLSHRFFGYPAYPLADYRRRRVRLALGTDSLASNDRLSIRAEARALAELAPDWPPLEILACATGALLGEEKPFGRRGRLIPGYPDRWALWRLRADRMDSLMGAGSKKLVETWLDETTFCERSSAHNGGI